MEYISNSAEETQKIAAEVAQKFKKEGGVVALVGELGAGKTTFTQGFAEGLGIEDKIISPTFVLIRQHKLSDSERMLFHIDLYRLEDGIDVSAVGLKEIFADSQNIVLIEWAEKIEESWPENILQIKFEKMDDEKRKIIISGPAERHST